MITPQFTLSQDEKCIYADIKAKYIKPNAIEFYIEGNNFRMQAANYSLNIYLSHKIIEVPSNKATYDVNTGIIHCILAKEKQGEIFTDLDMVSKLLSPNETFPNIKVSPSIEVVSTTETPDTTEQTKEEIKDEHGLQNIVEEVKINKSNCYGFNNQYSDIFSHRKEELAEISKINPELTNPEERYVIKCKDEQGDFDPEHYLSDTFEPEYITEIIKLPTPLDALQIDKLTKDLGNMELDKMHYTEEEFTRIKAIKNKEFLNLEPAYIMMLISDILYGYCYDLRTMQFAHTSESHWTIATLSSSLSYYVDWQLLIKELSVEKALKQLLVCCIRRSLIYPLYRNFKLSIKILDDVVLLLSCGRKYILKALLKIQKLFESAEPKYLLNIIYINDLCIAIQKYLDEVYITEWIQSIRKIKNDVSKKTLELGLDEIEKECCELNNLNMSE